MKKEKVLFCMDVKAEHKKENDYLEAAAIWIWKKRQTESNGSQILRFWRGEWSWNTQTKGFHD